MPEVIFDMDDNGIGTITLNRPEVRNGLNWAAMQSFAEMVEQAYERPDLDQLQKALVELEKRGYRLGRRERTMEGDGYRMRAEDLWARAQRAERTGACVFCWMHFRPGASSPTSSASRGRRRKPSAATTCR